MIDLFKCCIVAFIIAANDILLFTPNEYINFICTHHQVTAFNAFNLFKQKWYQTQNEFINQSLLISNLNKCFSKSKTNFNKYLVKVHIQKSQFYF